MDINYTSPLEVYMSDFTAKSIIDEYDSFVWTDAYCGYGDFEVKIPCQIAKRYNINTGDFIRCTLSDKIMIVEGIDINYDSDNSVMVTYRGRSLEALLCRRVLRKEDVPKIVPQINDQTGEYEAAEIRNLQDTILYVLKRTIVQNEDISISPNRGIQQLGYIENDDESLDELKAPYINLDGMTVYEFVKSVLEYNGLGFKIEYNPSGTMNGNIDNRLMLFSIYNGVNRGYTQVINNRIIFSPDEDTTYKMDTEIDMTSYGNAAIILGPKVSVYGKDEDDNTIIVETNRRYTTELYSGIAGIDRYEIYVDTTGIKTTNPYTDTLYPNNYIIAQMRFQGIQSLKQHLSANISCSPEIDFDPYKEYGRDYYVGDVVTVIDDFGSTNIVRIATYTHSVDSSGIQRHPVFESIPPIGGYRAVEQMENNEDIIRQTEYQSGHSKSNALRVTEHNNLELFDDTEI